MKYLLAVLAALWPTTAHAGLINERNSCTASTDSDCLPNYNLYRVSANFDDIQFIESGLDIESYQQLHFRGFQVVTAPTGPHLTPNTGSNYVRAYQSTGSFNTTAISSEGALMSFKSFYFGCQGTANNIPVPCNLKITGYIPVNNPQRAIGETTITYNYGNPGANGQAPLQLITGDDLANLRYANYYVFETFLVGESDYSHPRLVIDSIQSIYYRHGPA